MVLFFSLPNWCFPHWWKINFDKISNEAHVTYSKAEVLDMNHDIDFLQGVRFLAFRESCSCSRLCRHWNAWQGFGANPGYFIEKKSPPGYIGHQLHRLHWTPATPATGDTSRRLGITGIYIWMTFRQNSHWLHQIMHAFLPWRVSHI